MMGALGLIAGLWAEKFDQIAAFQNFIIMPMTFLSGVFYSVHSLPPFWQAVSHLNPFFYMIDGFRHGFFGVSDVSPWLSLAIVGHVLRAALAVTARSPAASAATSCAIELQTASCKAESCCITADELCKRYHQRRPGLRPPRVEGDGRHFYATIVSPEFEGKRAIQRHQRVYAALGR